MDTSDVRHRAQPTPAPTGRGSEDVRHPALAAGLLMAGVVLVIVVLSFASMVW